MEDRPGDIIPVRHLRRYGEVYPSAWEQAKEFRARKGEADFSNWPEWCFLPLAGSHAIIAEEATRQGLISDVDEPLAAHGLAADVGNLGALIAWRQTQGVYRFHETLYQSLWETPLDGDLPIELLDRLPEWCVWIDTESESDGANSHGFFAYLEHDIRTARRELRVVLSTPRALVNHTLHLSERTIAECLSAGYEEGMRQAFNLGRAWPYPVGMIETTGQAMSSLLAPRVSLLLYLCSVNGEVRNARHPGRQPGNPRTVKTKHGLKLFPAPGPARWEVGYRLGAALRAAQDVIRQESQGGQHASPRPHFRRAHWHTFLIGSREGPRHSVVKWLPPIPVNVGDDSDLIPAIKGME